MWQFIRSQILTVIIFTAVAHGILIVGPKFIRANQDYTVVISNFKPYLSDVNLMLRMEGRKDDGRNVLNVTKMVNLPENTNKKICFNMPEDLSAGNYKITIDGLRGFSFHKEANLVYLKKTVSGLIQIDKPVFKPGDTVHFRVIVLDSELKPPAQVKTVHVMICDPQNNVVRKWSSAKLYAGVFENDLQIAPTPILGIWNILVVVDEEALVSKTFEVKEYVLPLLDVKVTPTVIPLEEHQGLNLTIRAIDLFGKKVSGQVKVELYFEDERLGEKKEFELHGIGQVHLRFLAYLEEDQMVVRVKTTFIEQYAKRTVEKESHVTVYKYPYRVELITDIPYFYPGRPFKCALQFQHHDGTPAKGITGRVEVMDIDYETYATSDYEGLIKLDLNASDNIEEMYITFSNDDGFYFAERVDKMGVGNGNAYIKLELNSPIKLNQLLQFWVTSNEPMKFFVYYVMSKGNLIDSGFIKRKKGNLIDSGFIKPKNQSKYPLRFRAMENMIPKAKVIVATVANETVVHDDLDIDFEEHRNNIDISTKNEEVKPGEQIELRISGRPGAYVGLAAYDKDLLYYNQNHDLFWEDIMQVYNGFGPNVENEFEKFHSMGLFVRTLDDIKFKEDQDPLDGYEIKNRLSENCLYRTNFPESWLWKNVTIGLNGIINLTEIVPGSASSWYLTRFSIHPKYGLEIMKKSIQVTTIRPFYIVESLPHFIKLGHAVVLQFTLYNNLGREYNADVTLYNVGNQIEFIGRPLEDKNFTKSVSVPSKIGVPVLFLVKARSLGYMKIRVDATIKAIQEKDGLEKVIHVAPENVVQNMKDTRFFCLDTYANQKFRMQLDIDPKADDHSIAIDLQLHPNGLSKYLPNSFEFLQIYPLEKNKEDNIMRLVKYIMVRDYLHAIGSKDQSLINNLYNLLHQGYTFLMSIRQPDGSFSVWQNASGSVFLTALVATSMQTASKYKSEIDASVIEEAFDWLASKQHSSGRFDEIGTVFHNYIQGELPVLDIGLTSRVVIAFLENENAKVKHAIVVKNAINYLSNQFGNIRNCYDLSIVTYALMLNGHSLKDVALERLINMSTVTTEETERYWRVELRKETTAYALLSFVLAEKYLEGVPIMRWLVKKRYHSFEGLKALTKLAEKISPSRNDYTIQLKYKTTTDYFYINSQDINAVPFEDIPHDTKWIEINVKGIGVGLLELNYHYSLNLVNIENRFLLHLRKQNTTSDDELRLHICASFIPKLTEVRAKMVLIEVNFPSGYVVDSNSISGQTTINSIRKTEIRYGGTSVVVFYSNMGIERNCFTVTAYRQGEMTTNSSGYVAVCDFYDPSRNSIQTYHTEKLLSTDNDAN